MITFFFVKLSYVQNFITKLMNILKHLQNLQSKSVLNEVLIYSNEGFIFMTC